MTDNLDIFKNIVFSIPSSTKLVAMTLMLSIFYALLVFIGFKLFTAFKFPFYFIPLLAVLGFSLPSLFSGEILYRFLPDYPRRWGYFLAACNMSILFVYGLILTGADNFVNAWHIFWLALASVYFSNILVLLVTIGYSYFSRISLLSMIQPLTVLVFLHLLLGDMLRIGIFDYITGLSVILVAAILVILTLGLVEYLIRTNLKNTSVLELTAGLIQKKQEALDLGYLTRPDVQTLSIRNEYSQTDIIIPWIHPGPLEGFGGGRITSNILQELNDSSEGFFFHVPSTHKSDPADPKDYRKIVRAMQQPDKSTKASRLFSKQYERVTFHGRKIASKKIIFMDADWDDYEISVFREVIDPEEIVLVDLHCHDRKVKEREEVWYNTKDSEHLRNCLKDFARELEGLELFNYSAGFHTDSEKKPVFALIEDVGDQKTLMFGVEGNGTSEEVRKLRENYLSQYDQSLVFSTDTHQSLHQLSSNTQVATSRIQETIAKAAENLSKASIGFTNNRAESMKLLREDYSGLVFSTNILIRLMILLLAAVYTLLVAWIFF